MSKSLTLTALVMFILPAVSLSQVSPQAQASPEAQTSLVEPQGTAFLPITPGAACPGFYIAQVNVRPTYRPGYWGLEILLSSGDRLLQGGINLGGGFAANGGNPGFAAFNIANANNEAQNVTLSLNAQVLPTPGFNNTNFGMSVQFFQQVGNVRTPVGGPFVGFPPFNATVTLNPGFYVVNVQSLTGSPAGTYQLSLTTSYTNHLGGAFQGGVDLGGVLIPDSSGNTAPGFGAFCISDAQNVSLSAKAAPTYPGGATGLTLQVYDSNRSLVWDADRQPPTATLSASPSSISLGQSATLNWSSTNATTASISPGIGTVPTTGSRVISPSATTTYTLTVTGPGGSATSTMTVTVNAATSAPTASLSASPSSILQGQSTTLSWSFTNATSASISPGIGAVSTSGSRAVSPSSTTTYTLTVTGLGGSASATTTVVVSQPSINVSGLWQGFWTSTSHGLSGSLFASITQAGTALKGTFSVSTITSACGSGGTFSGSLAGPLVFLTAVFPGLPRDQQVNFTGTVNSAKNLMVGTYASAQTSSETGSLCGGDTGNWSLAKVN